MNLFGLGLNLVCTFYLWVLIARFVLDLVISVNSSFRPKGIVLFLAEVVFTLTDAPLKFLQRFIKPVRIGMMSFDFSWTVLLLAVSILADFGLKMASGGL